MKVFSLICFVILVTSMVVYGQNQHNHGGTTQTPSATYTPGVTKTASRTPSASPSGFTPGQNAYTSGLLELNGEAYTVGSGMQQALNNGTPVALSDASFPPHSLNPIIIEADASSSSRFFSLSSPQVAIGIDGFPIVAFARFSSATGMSSIRVAFCTDPYCANPVTPISLQAPMTGASFGFYQFSMTIDPTGVPIFLSPMTTDGYNTISTLFIRCNDRFCGSYTMSNPDTDEAVSQGMDGFFPSIAIGQNGFPVLVYAVTNDAPGIYIQSCTNPSCTQFMSNVAFINFYPESLSMVISPQTQSPVVVAVNQPTAGTVGTVNVVFCTVPDCSRNNTYTTYTNAAGNAATFSADFVSASVADNGNVFIYAYSSTLNASEVFCNAFTGCVGRTQANAGAASNDQAASTINRIYDVRTAVDSHGYPTLLTMGTYQQTSGNSLTQLVYSMCSDGTTCASITLSNIYLDNIPLLGTTAGSSPTTMATNPSIRNTAMTIGVYGYPVVVYLSFPTTGPQVRLISLPNRFADPYFYKRNN